MDKSSKKVKLIEVEIGTLSGSYKGLSGYPTETGLAIV